MSTQVTTYSTPVFVLMLCTGAILALVSVRYMLFGDYFVVGTSECNPQIGTCFEYCEADDVCNAYNIVRMRALDTPACSAEDESCTFHGCTNAGTSCVIVPCTSESLERYGYEGVSCVHG